MCINCNLLLPVPESVRKYLSLPADALSSIRNVCNYLNKIDFEKLTDGEAKRLEDAFGVGTMECGKKHQVDMANADGGSLLRIVYGANNLLSTQCETEMTQHLSTINFKTCGSLTLVDRSEHTTDDGFEYVTGHWVNN